MKFGNIRLKIVFMIIVIFFQNLKIEAKNDNCYRNVYIDLFNGSTAIGVNFDSRFPNSSMFGWRIGVGCSISLFPGYGLDNYCQGISLPFGVNALFGEDNNKFEVGIGVTPGIYSYQYQMKLDGEDENGNRYHGSKPWGPKSWLAGCAISIDLGYRLQRPKGFFFRVGLSPCLDFSSKVISLHGYSLFPYLSFGYSFK